MESLHRRNGNKFPELGKDVLRIYNMKYCPFAERTMLVLKHKNIPHEVININLKDKPDWFLARTPLGLVPVLERNETIVYDSTICNYYLDEIYPQNKIIPEDPYEKAQVSMLLEQFSKFCPCFYSALNPSKVEQREENCANIHKCLVVFEKALSKTFFGGTQPGLVDFNIWPFFERLGVLDAVMGKPTLTETVYPKLSKWVEKMNNVDAVKAVRLSTEVHAKFIEGHLKGKPEYDAVAA